MIKRYFDGFWGPEEDVDGNYVLYEDHAAIVEKMKAEIAELEADILERQRTRW